MKRMLLTVVLLAVGSTKALAEFSVQIGAYGKPDLADRVTAAEIDEVYTHRDATGLTRILVGHYGSTGAARSALEALKTLGYHDAFITRSRAVAPSRPAPHGTVPEADVAGASSRWSHLSAELREKVVLLDGRPHIKEGDTFTPLEAYLRP